MGVTNFAKSDLCQKQSKFRIQFCLGMLNNALYFPLDFAPFLRYNVCKKPLALFWQHLLSSSLFFLCTLHMPALWL